MPAKIVFLEGPNYCGKSTITKALAEILKQKEKSFIMTYEPGGDLIQEQIRGILLGKELNEQCEMDYTCRRMLYAASHAQLLQSLKKDVERYDYILIDRYNPISDLIYGVMDELDQEMWVKKLLKSENIFQCLENEFIMSLSTLVFLDISMETMLSRIEQRNTKENKLYDFKGTEFKKRVWEKYHYLSELGTGGTNFAKRFVPFENIYTIDANGTAEDVAKKILTLLEGTVCK